MAMEIEEEASSPLPSSKVKKKYGNGLPYPGREELVFQANLKGAWKEGKDGKGTSSS